MSDMQPFSSALQKGISSATSRNDVARKAARVNKVKTMWAGVVRACMPAAADMVLYGTNSVYMLSPGEDKGASPAEEKARAARGLRADTFKGAGNATSQVGPTLVVYVADSMVAAELNSRREMIKLKFLELFGEDVASVRICISRAPYKQRHAYPEKVEEPEETVQTKRVKLTDADRARIDEACSTISNDKLRSALEKAMISDFELNPGKKIKKDENRA